MKILIISNGSIGTHLEPESQDNNHTAHFLQNLKGGHTITYAGNSTSYDKNNLIKKYNMDQYTLVYKVLPNKKSIKFLPEVIKLVKEHDLLYLFYPGTLSTIVALIAYFFRKPYGLYIRGEFYNQYLPDPLILRNAQFMLTITQGFKDQLLQFCPNVEVIRPMISIKTEDLKMDRKYENTNKRNFLFVGRVEERKGINELIQIVKNLKKTKVIDFVLHIVGEGDLLETLQKQIKDLPIKDNIIFHGVIGSKTKLMDLYNGADAFIFTTHDEGFPRVLYEAMASALPIFTTFVGGITGQMEHLHNCIEIPVRNADTASEIILKYLKDPDTLHRIGSNGQKMVEGIINGSLLTHEELLLKFIDYKNLEGHI
jgi:glycosyltransferase involved in cell wall biosynthesis